MSKSDLVAFALTSLFVLGLVAYRLLWMASGTAAAAGLGRLPKLPQGLRRFLLGEQKTARH
jgi:hypothetical protein